MSYCTCRSLGAISSSRTSRGSTSSKPAPGPSPATAPAGAKRSAEAPLGQLYDLWKNGAPRALEVAGVDPARAALLVKFFVWAERPSEVSPAVRAMFEARKPSPEVAKLLADPNAASLIKRVRKRAPPVLKPVNTGTNVAAQVAPAPVFATSAAAPSGGSVKKGIVAAAVLAAVGAGALILRRKR